MTTIATDGITIAADSRSTRNREILAGQTQKIIIRNGRSIYASSGATLLRNALIEWHVNGANPKDLPVRGNDTPWALLVIEAPGDLTLYDDEAPYPVKLTVPFTMGSGRDFAMGAMLAGASPAEAVKIACAKDIYTGAPVQVVDIAEALGMRTLEAAE